MASFSQKSRPLACQTVSLRRKDQSLPAVGLCTKSISISPPKRTNERAHRFIGGNVASPLTVSEGTPTLAAERSLFFLPQSESDHRHRMLRQSHDEASPAARRFVLNENGIGPGEIVRSRERWGGDSFYLCLGTGNHALHSYSCRQCARRAGVHCLDEDLSAISSAACYSIEIRHGASLPARVKCRTADAGSQAFIAAVLTVKLVNQIDRRHEESLPVCLDDASGPAVHEVGDCAHLNQVAAAFEDVHQTRAIERRLQRILSLIRKVQSPLINREFDTFTGNNLAEQLFDLRVEAFEE